MLDIQTWIQVKMMVESTGMIILQHSFARFKKVRHVYISCKCKVKFSPKYFSHLRIRPFLNEYGGSVLAMTILYTE